MKTSKIGSFHDRHEHETVVVLPYIRMELALATVREKNAGRLISGWAAFAPPASHRELTFPC